jgi:hypothetical protein
MMVYDTQNHRFSGRLSSTILIRKLNFSYTGSVSIARWGEWETPTLLGPLERANLNGWSPGSFLPRPFQFMSHYFPYVRRYQTYSVHQGYALVTTVEALCYEPKGRGFESRGGHWAFSIYLILPASQGPGVYSASNRNEYQKIFLGVKSGWHVRLTT